jgi:hypothetical protein
LHFPSTVYRLLSDVYLPLHFAFGATARSLPPLALSREATKIERSTNMATITEQYILPPRMGDQLTREEFLRRWEAHPRIKLAELIGGTVYMPSPVPGLNSVALLAHR